MADIQLKEVFDTVQIPISDSEEAIDYNFNVAGGSATSIHSSSTLPINLIPTGINNDTWHIKRQGITLNTSDFTNCDPTGAFDDMPAYDTVTVLDMLHLKSKDEWVYAIGHKSGANYRLYVCVVSGGANWVLNVNPSTIALTSSSQVYLSEIIVLNQTGVAVNITNSAINPTSSTSWYALQTAGAWTASSLTQITDADFPSGATFNHVVVGPLVQLNSFIYALTKFGSLHNSDINSISSWNALGFVYAFSRPNNGVTLQRYKNHLLAFGDRSIEFWNDIGNAAPASPLGRVDQAFQRIGTLTARTICEINNQLYWLATDSTSILGLYTFDQYTPVKLSDRSIDQFLRTSSDGVTKYRFTVLNFNGTVNIVMFGLNIKYPALLTQASFTSDPNYLDNDDFQDSVLTYCLDSKKFWCFSHAFCHGTFHLVGPRNYPTSTSTTASAYLGIDSAYSLTYPDAGSWCLTYRPYDDQCFDAWWGSVDNGYYPVFCGFQTATHRFGNLKRKRIHKISAIIDNQQNCSSNPMTGLPSTTSWGWFIWNKGGASVSTTFPVLSRAVNLQDNLWNPRITNLGMARNWNFGFAECSGYPLKIRGLELEISQGTS